MKYTDQEIVDKFSKVDFDKNGLKKQAILNRVTQACATRRTIMFKKYSPLITAAIILVVAIPAFIMTAEHKRKGIPAETPVITDGALAAAPATPADDPSESILARAPLALITQESEDEMYESAEATEDSVDYADAVPAALPNHTFARIVRPSFGVSSRAGASMKSANFSGGRGLMGGHVVGIPKSAPEPVQVSQDSKAYTENGFKKALLEPLSTFSADVDTASYNMVKAQITRGWTIEKDGVRTEAFINNFAYQYPAPKGNDPVSINIEYAPAPWNDKNQLVRIGVKAQEIDKKDLPQSNLVFLIDVSGSMDEEDRLPLVKKAFKMLLNQLNDDDIVSIVTYASGVGVKLDGVKVKNKQKIIAAIDSLRASGATYGEEGLKKAYEVAKKNFLRKGNNRIIIASDGDFNVGDSSAQGIEKQVSQAKESGVFISALGFGMGNYRDHMMETIADKGNGNYAYINDLKAAQKALVREFGGTMFTVAKDVKFQVEFNPAVVEEYRLIGYEKRLLNSEDFNDDTKDAGEMGAGHTVTVFYEIRPKNGAEKMDIDPLKYTQAQHTNEDEVLTVKMRYKDPQGDTSKLLSQPLNKKDLKKLADTSEDFRFAAAAAAFGQLLRDGQFLNGFTAKQIADMASKAKGTDDSGDRAEFVQLVRTYADTPTEEVDMPTVSVHPDAKAASRAKYIEGLDAFNQDDFQKARTAWEVSKQLDPNNTDAELGLRKLDEMFND